MSFLVSLFFLAGSHLLCIADASDLSNTYGGHGHGMGRLYGALTDAANCVDPDSGVMPLRLRVTFLDFRAYRWFTPTFRLREVHVRTLVIAALRLALYPPRFAMALHAAVHLCGLLSVAVCLVLTSC